MLKKPIYENENNVELYALYSSESNSGQKKCPRCGRSGMTVAAAVLQGYEVPGGASLSAWYCSHCGIVY